MEPRLRTLCYGMSVPFSRSSSHNLLSSSVTLLAVMKLHFQKEGCGVSGVRFMLPKKGRSLGLRGLGFLLYGGWGSVGFGTKEIMDRSSPDQGSSDWNLGAGPCLEPLHTVDTKIPA